MRTEEFQRRTTIAGRHLPLARAHNHKLRTLGRWHLATILLLLFGFLFPLLFTNVRLSSLRLTPVLLSIVVIEWSAVRIVNLLLKGEARLIQATFWSFVYVWFGLAALAQTAGQRFPILNQSFSLRHQTNAVLTVIIGLAAYEVGMAARHRAKAPLAAIRALSAREIDSRRVWMVAFFGLFTVLVAVATVGLAVLFSSRAGVTEAFLGAPSPGQRPDQVSNKASGLLRAVLTWSPAFLALYLLLILRQARRSGAIRKATLISSVPATGLLLALFIGTAIANNPFGTPRYRIGGVVFALLLACWPARTPRRYSLILISLLSGILFIFPLADVFRNETRNYEITPLATELAVSPDFGMFQQEVNAQLYVDRMGFTFGDQVLGVVFAFVPRSVWPEKPIDTGNLISRTDRINASASLWATVFVDGGWLAVATVFLFYGWLTGVFEDLFLRSHGVSFLTAAVPLFAAFQLLLLRGDLQPAVGELALLPVLLLFCTRRSLIDREKVR